MLFFCSCAKQESTDSPKPNPESPAGAQPAAGPHASVQLVDGSKVPGTIVASSATDMVVDGDDGIERKIPLAQVKSVVYDQAKPEPGPAQASGEPSSPNPQAPARPAVTTRTYELPEGSELSVRTNEEIDSATAAEGQTFAVQVTRDALDANGAVVIPRRSSGRAIIKSASKGDRFHGASDLVLDLQSVTISGKRHTIDTAEITQKGKDGVGANKRTAVYTGGGAAVGAIIGAIAGGGKGAAIGAGAGAGAGAITQVVTKGGSIKVPAESVLTFKLDKPLRVTVAQ
jgi:hypothetical protein